MDRVIVIVGPTASGKTALTVELAKRIDGELFRVILCRFIGICLLELRSLLLRRWMVFLII